MLSFRGVDRRHLLEIVDHLDFKDIHRGLAKIWRMEEAMAHISTSFVVGDGFLYLNVSAPDFSILTLWCKIPLREKINHRSGQPIRLNSLHFQRTSTIQALSEGLIIRGNVRGSLSTGANG